MFIAEARASEAFKQYIKQQVKFDRIVEYADGAKQRFWREKDYGATDIIDRDYNFITKKQKLSLDKYNELIDYIDNNPQFLHGKDKNIEM